MGDCSFYINKLKFEIFNDKQNLFFSAISKNLNWEMLTKNLVSLGMGLRVKNFTHRQNINELKEEHMESSEQA